MDIGENDGDADRGTGLDVGGGRLGADADYGMAGPGHGMPYAGLTRSGVHYRALRYG